MRRFSIRLRVAAAFGVAMAIVLAAAGILIYVRVGDDLSQALDQDLKLRAQDLTALVRGPGDSLKTEAGGHLVEAGESFAELVELPYREARGRLLEKFESAYLEHLLKRAEGKVSKAARIASMNRSYLRQLLARYNPKRT